LADPTPSVSASIAPLAPAAPPAPPEAIALDLAAVEKAFAAAGNARFLDLSGRFSFDDRQRIAGVVAETAQKTGSKVYVLAIPGKTDVNAYAAIHKDLSLAPRDVLFIFSADKRHLHSQAIPKSVGNEILKDTNKEFYKSQPNGVVQMLEQIAARLSTGTTATTSAPSAAPVTTGVKKPMLPIEWVLIAVAVAVIAYLLLNTRKNDAKPAKPARKATPKPPREDDAEA
jgi:hypothetical protein